VPHKAHTKIVVYNLLGARVKTLVDEVREAGVFSVTWNGTDEAGVQAASGIYFYEMRAETFRQTRKLFLMR
jgi:flagellar hook assembly protein FlgD